MDIRAQNLNGDIYNIEMQAAAQRFYPERIVYYWAKLFSGQLREGEPYENLCNTYSVNFLDFRLFKQSRSYKSRFLLLEKDNPDIQLTEKLQVVFFELPKFDAALKKVGDNLGLWLYTIKNTPLIDEAAMQKIIYTNPAMAEAFATLKRLSMDPDISGAAAMREKAIKDYNTNMRASYREGRAEGEAKGRAEGEAKGRAEGEAKGRAEGEAKGRAEGEAKGRAGIVKNMFCAGSSIPDIAKFTGLSIAEIEKIKSESD